jgi:hypothetical protein
VVVGIFAATVVDHISLGELVDERFVLFGFVCHDVRFFGDVGLQDGINVFLT